MHKDTLAPQNAQTVFLKQAELPKYEQAQEGDGQGPNCANANTADSQEQESSQEENTVRQQFQQFGAEAAYLSAVKSAYFAHKLQFFFSALIFGFITINFARSEWVGVGIGVATLCVIWCWLDARQKKVLGFVSNQTKEGFEKFKEKAYQAHFNGKSKETAIWIVELVLFVLMFCIVHYFFENLWESFLFCLFFTSVISSFIRLCWLLKWVGAVIVGIFVVLLITHPVIVLLTLAAFFSTI